MNELQYTSAITEFSPKLLSHAYKFTKDEDDAKDLLQETLIKGVRSLSTFTEGTNLKGWLFIIMRNTYINQFVKQDRRNEIFKSREELQGSANQVSINMGERSFVMEDINKAMLSINSIYRIPFLKYFEGYKYDEIAEELGIPVGTVKTHIHQARVGLKKYLKMYR